MPHALAHDACTGSPLARVFGICPRLLCGLSRRSQLYWQWLGQSGWEISCAKCNLPMLAWGRAVFWQSLLIPLTWTLHCSPCWASADIARVILRSLGLFKGWVFKGLGPLVFLFRNCTNCMILDSGFLHFFFYVLIHFLLWGLLTCWQCFGRWAPAWWTSSQPCWHWQVPHGRSSKQSKRFEHWRRSWKHWRQSTGILKIKNEWMQKGCCNMWKGHSPFSSRHWPESCSEICARLHKSGSNLAHFTRLYTIRYMEYPVQNLWPIWMNLGWILDHLPSQVNADYMSEAPSLKLVRWKALISAGRRKSNIYEFIGKNKEQREQGSDEGLEDVKDMNMTDTFWHSHAVFHLTGSRAGFLVLPSLVALVVASLIITASQVTAYACSRGELTSLQLTNSHSLEFHPWQTRYEVLLDTSFRQVTLVASSDPSTTQWILEGFRWDFGWNLGFPKDSSKKCCQTLVFNLNIVHFWNASRPILMYSI